MQINHRREPLQGIRDLLKRLDNVRLGEIETRIENRVEQTLLARHVVVQPGLRETRSCRDIAHRRVVIALAVKYFCRNFEHSIASEPITLALFAPFWIHCSDLPTDR